jgi:hypothetical protein
MDDIQLAGVLAVVYSRAAERILLVLVGAVSVYLGYRLFVRIPNANRSEGKFELPGGVSIFMTRIGPGVFFALFGVAVIGYSVTRPVEFALPTDQKGAITFSGLGQGSPNRSGATESPSPTDDIVVAGAEPRSVVAHLNGILENARQTMSGSAADEFAQAIRAAKYAVMLGDWDPDWGDRNAFAAWARGNGTEDPPLDLVPGAAVVFGATIR